jgi:site-specific DNA-methyltransferase (cytosine-N4-specific)
MPVLDYNKVEVFIQDHVIEPFYEEKFKKLQNLQLKNFLSRKNPYLYKAKNATIVSELVESMLDSYLSSQEETILGNLMEKLAIYICELVFNGKKAEEKKFKSIDLIFETDLSLFIVGIKSGPSWGNADQIKKMQENFKKARIILQEEGIQKSIRAINGCIYGKENRPLSNNPDPDMHYEKICGQAFWELISGDVNLYKKIIKPMELRAKQNSDKLDVLYTQKVNGFTDDFSASFCTNNLIDWEKLLDFISKNKS